MSVSQIISDIAPEFSTVDAAKMLRMIAIATSQLSSSVFGDQYDYAVALKTCHMLTIAARSGSGGPVSSETEGSLSRSYSVNAGFGLDSTSYGMELKSLMNSLIISPMTVEI